MNGRQMQPAVLRHTQLFQPAAKFADARVAVRDAGQPLRRPHLFFEKPRELDRHGFGLAGARAGEDDAIPVGLVGLKLLVVPL